MYLRILLPCYLNLQSNTTFKRYLDAQPDFVVLMESFIRLGLLQNETFLAEYEQIAFFPTDYYGAGMMAFRRIPVME